MSSNAHMQTRWRRRIGFFLAFFVAESAVLAIITLSPYMSFATLLPIHAALAAVLFVLALFLRRSEWGRRYASVCAAFFVAAVAVLPSTAYSDELLQLFGVSIDTRPRSPAYSPPLKPSSPESPFRSFRQRRPMAYYELEPMQRLIRSVWAFFAR